MQQTRGKRTETDDRGYHARIAKRTGSPRRTRGRWPHPGSGSLALPDQCKEEDQHRAEVHRTPDVAEVQRWNQHEVDKQQDVAPGQTSEAEAGPEQETCSARSISPKQQDGADNARRPAQRINGFSHVASLACRTQTRWKTSPAHPPGG